MPNRRFYADARKNGVPCTSCAGGRPLILHLEVTYEDLGASTHCGDSANRSCRG
jgi:hypothetical protein